MKSLINWVLIIISIYFFSENNIIFGVIFAVLALYRIIGTNNINTIFSGTVKTSQRILESNVQIELLLNVKEILQHPKTRKYFDRMKKENHESFIETLLKNYQEEYKKEKDDIYEKVTFNIKNNLLWKNKDIQFVDVIYHEITIPWDMKTKESELWGKIGLEIRVLVVNGLIKVQIGRYSKGLTSKMINDGGLASYVTYDTITTYPLMYTFFSLPERYLLPNAKGTESYKELQVGGKDWLKDWKEFAGDLNDYNKVFNLNEDDGVEKEDQEAMGRLMAKGRVILEQENFEDKNKRDDNWGVPPWMEVLGDNYSNKYLTLYVWNLNEHREKFKDYQSVDWYEEYP